MKKLIPFIALLFFLSYSVFADYEIIRVTRNESAVIECARYNTTKCILKKADTVEASRFVGRKFRVNSTEDCVFVADNLQFFDMNKYSCQTDNTSREFYLLVTVTPEEPELWHMGARIKNDSRSITLPRPDGTAHFDCRSNQGYPRTKFLWFVNDVLVTGNEDVAMTEQDSNIPIGGLLNSRSLLAVNFDVYESSMDRRRNPRREVLIKCIVQHAAYNLNESRILQATFGRAYATEVVEFLEISTDDTGNVKEVICEADGLPEADDFKIMFKDEAKNDWVDFANEPVVNLTKAGTYACFARNHQDGEPLRNYIQSNEIVLLQPVTLTETKKSQIGVIFAAVFGTLAGLAILVGIFLYIYCKDKPMFRSYSVERVAKEDAQHASETERMNVEENDEVKPENVKEKKYKDVQTVL